MKRICCQSTVRNFHAAVTMRFTTLRCKTRSTLATAAARNLDASIPLRSADTELQSTKELRTTAPQIATILQIQNRILTPKQKNNDFEALLKRNFQRKSSMPKSKKSAAKAPFATWISTPNRKNDDFEALLKKKIKEHHKCQN